MSVGGFESAFIAAKSIEDLAGVGSTRDRKLSVTLEWTNFATDCISSRSSLSLGCRSASIGIEKTFLPDFKFFKNNYFKSRHF